MFRITLSLIAVATLLPSFAASQPRRIASGVVHVGIAEGSTRAVSSDLLVFQGTSPSAGIEPWRSDGTEAGTFAIGNIAAGSDNSWPHSFTTLNGFLLFAASDASGSRPLWRTEGTSDSTIAITDGWAKEGAVPFAPMNLATIGDYAYFSAVVDGSVWRSDGTANGTVLLANDVSGSNGFTAVGDTVVFAAGTADEGVELWRTDGTAAGTQLLLGIAPGMTGSEPRSFVRLGAHILFVANDTAGSQIWRTDGTPEGTSRVTDLPTGVIGPIVAADGIVFFAGRDANGLELWETDGTSEGTRRVADICPGPCESAPGQLTVFGGRLYFTASDGIHGQELWTSDGTATGTRMLRDIQPPSVAIYPKHLTVAGNRLFFVADDGASGEELWVSDGTEAGTRLYADLTPGAAGTHFEWLAASSQGLFFATQQSGAYRFDLWFSRLVGDELCGSGDSDGDGAPDCVEIAEGMNPHARDNDIFADPRLFAMQQYRDFLGREGDAGGVDFWARQVDATLSRGQVIESLFGMPEFQGTVAPVARLYFAYFLRAPDYGGLDFWVAYFRDGNTLEAISDYFARSPEFAQRYGALDNGEFVDLVYRNILGRTPDPQGLAFWTAELDAGRRSRGQVMLGFSESAEYFALTWSEVYVTMAYLGMLRRAPDPGGFSFWVDYLDGGKPGLALIDGFLRSSEYRRRFLP